MSYAFVRDVPANEEIYAQIRSKLPAAAPGLIAHLAIRRDEGLRYVDVWESEAAWDRFREDHVDPVVTEVLAGYGLPHDHSVTPLEVVDLVDVWIGAGAG